MGYWKAGEGEKEVLQKSLLKVKCDVKSSTSWVERVSWQPDVWDNTSHKQWRFRQKGFEGSGMAKTPWAAGGFCSVIFGL